MACGCDQHLCCVQASYRAHAPVEISIMGLVNFDHDCAVRLIAYPRSL